MRSEMGLPPGLPILEALDELPEQHSAGMRDILARHESQGVERAVLFPGVLEFLDELTTRGLRRGVLTRNSRASTEATLVRFGIDVHAVHTRDDGPAKPDPSGVWRICEAWGLKPSECVMIGDYRFDIEAGRQAGAHTVLFTGGRKHSVLADHERADFTLASFGQATAFWEWVERKKEKKREAES